MMKYETLLVGCYYTIKFCRKVFEQLIGVNFSYDTFKNTSKMLYKTLASKPCISQGKH